jgi:hypothetical protein
VADSDPIPVQSDPSGQIRIPSGSWEPCPDPEMITSTSSLFSVSNPHSLYADQDQANVDPHTDPNLDLVSEFFAVIVSNKLVYRTRSNLL